MTRTDCQQCK